MNYFQGKHFYLIIVTVTFLHVDTLSRDEISTILVVWVRKQFIMYAFSLH